MTFTLTPKEFSDKVADALESGRFKQGIGHLVVRDSLDPERRFCCLGVACEVFIEEGGTLERTSDECGYLLPGEGTSWDYLPGIVQEALDVSEESPSLKRAGESFQRLMTLDIDPDISTNLASVNDHGISFEKIAVIFRERLFRSNVP